VKERREDDDDDGVCCLFVAWCLPSKRDFWPKLWEEVSSFRFDSIGDRGPVL